jgi:HEPN domain-containing protein
MKPRSEEEGSRWLRQAEQDLSSAEILRKGQRYDTACFMAQQAAEKTLKAFLYARGEEVVLGHSVAKLCDWAGRYDAAFRKLKKKIKELDTFYVGARYPNGLVDNIPAEFYDEGDAERAVAMAKEAIGLVKGKMK